MVAAAIQGFRSRLVHGDASHALGVSALWPCYVALPHGPAAATKCSSGEMCSSEKY